VTEPPDPSEAPLRSAVPVPSPRNERIGEDVAAGVAGSPLLGRPVALTPRWSRPDVEAYARAADGPPPFVVRLKQIERMRARHERRLAEAREALAAEVGVGDAFAARWRELAATWDLSDVNELIRRHNLYYPIERRLPLDPRTRDYVPVQGADYRLAPLDAAWVLRRFPAEPTP
jgi:hypothetical protein